ncbi:MAG: phosphoribosyl 1,2-cyclic phosphodiesterase [Planctomycetota bacterium]
MRLQILGSGSGGNSALLWADETVILIDAGLPIRTLTERIASTGIGFRAIDHVIVSHGHLDHSRSAGIIAKRHGATLHCAARIQEHRSVSRAPDKSELPINGSTTLEPRSGSAPATLRTVKIPHDCEPTLAFRIEHGGRTLSFLTDMGEPRDDAAAALANSALLVLESNYDEELLKAGPYPASLKSRVRGSGGHLSNEQMTVMLTRMAGPELHTVVLAHLSAKNNRPDLAVDAARDALRRLGRDEVKVIAAKQDQPLEPIQV